MPRWLSTASNALRGGETVDAPEPFELQCICGNPLQGLRGPRYQEVPCTRCGEHVFVLPRDPYPQPVKKAPKPKKTKKAKEPKGTAKKTKTAAPAPPPQPAVLVKEGKLLNRQKRGQGVKPVHLVISAVLLVTAATGYWLWHKRHVDALNLQLSESLAQAEAELAENNLTTAAEKYRAASAALDGLAREDADAQRIRQFSRETTAGANLALISPFEIVQDAEAHRGQQQAWDDRFQTNYAGRWLLIEALVIPPGLTKSGQFEVDYPLTVGEATVKLVADLNVFHEQFSENEARKAIFAAQLDSCLMSRSAEPAWIIELNPKSAFLWSSADMYRRVARFAADPEQAEQVDQLLRDQSALLEIEP